MILIYTFTHPKTFTQGHVSVNEKKLKLSHENVKNIIYMASKVNVKNIFKRIISFIFTYLYRIDKCVFTLTQITLMKCSVGNIVDHTI